MYWHADMNDGAVPEDIYDAEGADDPTLWTIPALSISVMRQISADYTRVKRVFGPEQVQAAVEADKQREQAEKGRKRPRRSLDRGGR